MVRWSWVACFAGTHSKMWRDPLFSASPSKVGYLWSEIPCLQIVFAEWGFDASRPVRCAVVSKWITHKSSSVGGISLRPRDEKRALFCSCVPCCQPILCSHLWEPCLLWAQLCGYYLTPWPVFSVYPCLICSVSLCILCFIFLFSVWTEFSFWLIIMYFLQ